MANAYVVIRDLAGASDVLGVLARMVFAAADDRAPSSDWLAPGKVAVAGALPDTAGGLSALRVNLRPGLLLPDIAAASDTLAWPAVVARAAFVVVADVADSLDTGAARRVTVSVLVSVAESADALDPGAPLLPVLRAPLPGETAGAVNLVRNPSLEYADVGLLDWSSQAGITLARDGAAAWDGAWSALATVASGAGAPEMRIDSQAGLRLTGPRQFGGSLALWGDAAAVSLRLRLWHTDATSVDGEVSPFTLGGTAARYEAIAVSPDPAKLLDRVQIVVSVTQSGAAQSVRADAAQVQEVTDGGAALAYVDGDQGDGYAWWGAPGASISYREPGP